MLWQQNDPPTDQQLQQYRQRLLGEAEVSNQHSSRDAYHSTWRQSQQHMLASNEEQEQQIAGWHGGETQPEPRQDESMAAPPFSVTVSSMTGVLFDIPNLQPKTQIFELCQKVAELCSMPPFAVRLLHQTEVLHMSWTDVSLDDLGLKQGSQLLLVKQFGWAKPNLQKLSELQRHWQGGA